MPTEKSTNVRSNKLSVGVRAIVMMGRFLGKVSPALSARWARWVFFHTSRRTRPARERAALAIARRSTLPFEGGRLAVWEWGRGPVVLLSHGWNGRGGQLHAFVEPLVASGHRVVTWDGPGHGASTGSWSSLPQLGRALGAVARELGTVRAIVSHSLGGPAAMLAVRDGLTVERLVMISPPADAAAWLTRLADGLRLSPEARSHTTRLVEARAGVKLAQLNVQTIMPSLPSVPMHIVHDREDREVAFADGETIATLGGGTLQPTTGLGHQRILHAPEVIDAVETFVGRASPSAASRAIEQELFDRPQRWAQVAALT